MTLTTELVLSLPVNVRDLGGIAEQEPDGHDHVAPR